VPWIVSYIHRKNGFIEVFKNLIRNRSDENNFVDQKLCKTLLQSAQAVVLHMFECFK